MVHRAVRRLADYLFAPVASRVDVLAYLIATVLIALPTGAAIACMALRGSRP